MVSKTPKYLSAIFFLKFVTYLNAYGNAFFLLAVVSCVSALVTWNSEVNGLVRFLVIGVSVITALVAGYHGAMITISYNRKRRYYILNWKRLGRHGFKATYFEDEMYEPCMRLLIRDLLRVKHLSGHYRELVAGWKSGPMTLTEKRRLEILASLD